MIKSQKPKTEAKTHFIEYLRSIFGNDEQINSLTDLKVMLEEQLKGNVDMSRTDVDKHYDNIVGVLKVSAKSIKKYEEESKVTSIQPGISYLEKCKKIGKLGPVNCRMSIKDAFGSWFTKSIHILTQKIDDEGLDVQCKSPFGSIRANTCVFSGAWYYEVRLMSRGIIQLGWSTLQTKFAPEEGVGDSADSFAYDGNRVMRWNNGRNAYGEAWEIGDIIGCYIDLTKREISYSRNGRTLGVAFKGILVGENIAYFPAATMEHGERVVFNFGKRLTLNTVPNFLYLNECESESTGINSFVSGTLLEAFKRVLTENQYKGMQISVNDKRLVAYIIWEYIFSAMNYNMVLEKTILPFFSQLNAFPDMDYLDFTIMTMLNYCSDDQLLKWSESVFRILCENHLSYSYIDEDKNKDQIKSLALVSKLVKFPRILATWIKSENFFTDLENLYFTHLPSKTDLDKNYPYIYYPNTIFQTSSKAMFYKNMSTQCLRCTQNEDLLSELTKLLMSEMEIPLSDGSKVAPRLVMINFLDYLIKKNVKYVQEIIGAKSDLTFPSSITNIVFCILSYLEPMLLISHPKNFMFSLLYRADGFPEFTKLDRMGGTLTHLLTEYDKERNSTFKELEDGSPTKAKSFLFELFNKVIILFNYVVTTEFAYGIRGFEKFIQLTREMDEQTDERKFINKTAREEEIKNFLLLSIPYQHYLFTCTNIRLMHKLSFYILELSQFIIQKCPELFYFIPVYYDSVLFTIIRAFLRADVQSLEFLWTKAKVESVFDLTKDSLIDSFINYVSDHLGDKKIPNPDMQESFLMKFGIVLQYKDVVTRIENCPPIKSKLLHSFLLCFDRKSVNVLSKNFLRMFKKSLFNDVNYSVLGDSGYKFFRDEFVEKFTSDPKLKETFLNQFLSNINNAMSDMKLQYSESCNISITTREREEHKREAKAAYNIIYDMLRVLETIASMVPFIFLEQGGLFTQRVSDLCMIVIREGIQGQICKFLAELSAEEYKKTETVQMLLSPIMGTYVSLIQALAKCKDDKSKYTTIEEYIIKSDGFEVKLMKTFVDSFKDTKKMDKSHLASLSLVRDVVGSLDKFIEKNFSPEKVVKISEEKLCQICFISEVDTIIMPCEHTICEKCITIHKIGSNRCPFCNADIMKITKKEKSK